MDRSEQDGGRELVLQERQERNELIGGRLAHLRERAGISRSEMARRVGMVREGYIQWELGKVRIPLIELPAIARAFDLEETRLLLDYLMPETPEQVQVAEQLADSFTRRRLERLEQEIASMPPPPTFAITSRLDLGFTRKKKAGNRHDRDTEGGLRHRSALPMVAAGR